MHERTESTLQMNLERRNERQQLGKGPLDFTAQSLPPYNAEITRPPLFPWHCPPPHTHTHNTHTHTHTHTQGRGREGESMHACLIKLDNLSSVNIGGF